VAITMSPKVGPHCGECRVALSVGYRSSIIRVGVGPNVMGRQVAKDSAILGRLSRVEWSPPHSLNLYACQKHQSYPFAAPHVPVHQVWPIPFTVRSTASNLDVCWGVVHNCFECLVQLVRYVTLAALSRPLTTPLGTPLSMHPLKTSSIALSDPSLD
jgi:hypothetical protein